MLTLLDLSYPNNTLSHLTSNIHNLYLHYLHFSLSSLFLIIILSSKNLGISIGRGSISLTLSASLDSRSLCLSKIFPGRSHSPTLHGLCLPLFPPSSIFFCFANAIGLSSNYACSPPSPFHSVLAISKISHISSLSNVYFALKNDNKCYEPIFCW